MKKKLTVSVNAPVVLSFALLCFVALILGFITGGFLTRLLFMTYHTNGFSILDPVRLFTHVLGHSGWDHFIGNMAYILLLGPMLEEKYGSGKVLEVILITAFVTSVINSVFFPSVALCGASGVVFAMILLSSFGSFEEGTLPLTFLLVAALYLGQQLYDGIFVRDNVSNLTHIVGGGVGAFLGYRMNRKG